MWFSVKFDASAWRHTGYAGGKEVKKEGIWNTILERRNNDDDDVYDSAMSYLYFISYLMGSNRKNSLCNATLHMPLQPFALNNREIRETDRPLEPVSGDDWR